MDSIGRKRRGYVTRVLCVALLGVVSLPAFAQSQDLVFRDGYENADVGTATPAQAARFLTQATFGPTLSEIQRVQTLGYQSWLDEQFGRTPELHLPFLDARAAAGDDLGGYLRQESWFARVVRGNDQLRQRVAFALSEILVVSERGFDDTRALAHYYDLLVQRAFGNYRTLLRDVTLHPTMAEYLSMRANQPEDPAENIRPDENYAREIMQLFSIGLEQLNPDGTRQLANGQPIPTYTQATIRGFARVFTGFNFDGCDPDDYGGCYPYETGTEIWWRRPMIAFAGYHETSSKQLLVYPGVALPGGVLPAGGTAITDLDAALDNLFNHPNVGPFVSRHLIQRLVTSNPTPAYVARVAAVFANNGSGQRGDLRAVVRQILLDPEARNPATAPAHAGKVREPLLRLTQLYRALDARSQDGRFREWYPDSFLAQAALASPTVFNFFRPGYAPTGEIANAGLAAPELQIATDNVLTSTANAFGNVVYYYWRGNPDVSAEDVTVDLARDMALATQPATLIDRYDLLFLSGRMSAGLRATLLSHLGQIDAGDEAGRRERVQDALWLIMVAPEFVVEK